MQRGDFMPKRKTLPKLPDYTGIPQNEELLVVQKSNPLQSLSETGMTLTEFKILDAYLSKIDSHDAEKRYVRFEKGELEQILGVDRIRTEELSKRLDNLFRVVTIKDKLKQDGFTKIALFEKAEAHKDENGFWQIDLACTYSAMEYIFNIDAMGYLPYMLKNIISLTSRYSYVLYLYLESHRRFQAWEESIESLKKILNCTASTYEQYYRFNDLILKKCQKELHEKTDLRFSYEPVKKGRTYSGILFTIESDSEPERLMETGQVNGQYYLTAEGEDMTDAEEMDEESAMLEKYGSPALALFASAMNYEFSQEETRVLYDIVKANDFRLERQNDAVTRHDFMQTLYHQMQERAAKSELPPVEHRFLYLRKLLMEEFK